MTSRTNPLVDYLMHASNFLPAIVFLFYGRFGPGTADLRWTTAFVIGGALAVFHGAWLLRRAQRNSIAIGVDLYLLIGGALALASPRGSELWGEQLGPAAMLVCVLVVGIVHTAWSAGGFVDIAPADRARVRSLSLVMLAVTVTALAVSVAMRHSPLWGGVVPLVALVVVRGRLRRQLAQAS
ncbi:permease [Burkholderia gladioli]|uniref:Permease n=1 Tax=Burkholderia gladioli TaxID=28095 RepID=A0A2A7SAY2_BURGA|nr:permease [Burkholderia gladioli]MBU9426029.1 permease [Burkholderia gladioli]MDN8063111.1 permease [Burkholderia gladioli]PEH40731.1 permease [Burkholderia gladioli]QPQ87688.1 permease [Burkholderia gladioli]